MIYNRGQRADFDNWAQRGNRGWGYVDVLPYFKRTERRIGVADDRIHGREGNLPVTDIDWIHPICEAFIAGAVGTRHPALRRLQQRRPPGGCRLLPARHPSRLAAVGGARVPASGAATGRLDVRTDARAAQVLFEGKRAVGVRYVNDRDRSTQHVVRARREVILSCGTANTAKLLQMSGVGPAALLQ